MSRGPTRRWRLVRAHREAVPASVRRFNRRVQRRRLRAAAPWAAGLGVLLAGGLVAWLLYGTSVLGVRQVRVEGTAILSADQVRAAAALPPDTPLARVDLDQVRRRVAALPPVARVDVERDWPDRVRISVVERTPVAAVPGDGGFRLLDGSGVVFHTVAARPAGLPLVRLNQPDPRDPTTRSALRVLAALTPELRDRVVEVVAEAPARIRLLLPDNRVVIWGDATDNETKAKVATALLDHPGTQIDVSAPEVVTVR